MADNYCEVRINMKKKILGLFLIIVMMFSLIGCAKLLSTTYEEVEVTITDEYYRSSYVTPVMASGKVTTFISHPAIYRIIVEYNDVEYTISDRDTYKKYKDKIGQTTIGTLSIRIYDDGNIKYNITELE